MSVHPTVSVVMPVHNAERFVEEAIRSVLSQTFADLELILIDDGSTDRSPAILRQYRDRDDRVRLIVNATALGFGGEKACNEAYRQARGTYVAKLDADDRAHPDRLARQVAFLEGNPNVFLVGSWLEIIDGQGRTVGVRKYPTDHAAIFREFYFRSCIGHPSILFRNGVVPGDFYELKFPHLNDYYSFFRHMRSGLEFANIPACLTAYRVHTSNTVFTGLREKWNTNMAIKKVILEESGIRPPLHQKAALGVATGLINTVPERRVFQTLNFLRQAFTL
ncbi:glycosyltransferase family 2 protein [Larkinella soli]|uniref:glycosyltransferase family 2 protein n=1 Tax=Larkinella soli TaxID=1770527 RepID=UPI000FFB499C|nr:glycosyltransferase family 2 protein [Larkinella soli]